MAESPPPVDPVELAEQGVRQAERNGWVEIVGQDAEGRACYRLTEAGRRHAAEVLGWDPDRIA